MNESMLSLTINRMGFGWTKWGGGNQGLFTLLPNEKWFCQTCGSEQVRHLPSYMIPIDIEWRNFIKVCTLCKYKSIVKHLKFMSDLLKEVKDN